MKAVTLTIAITGIMVAGVMALVIASRVRQSSMDTATRSFRDGSITEITRLTADAQSVSNRVASMARQSDEEDRWFSEHIIVMKTGEWVVYVSKCSKEDPRIRDTFVCRASDGGWYESTFHFCIGAIVLRMEGQPADLRAFITQYRLSPLPGQPNTVLKHPTAALLLRFPVAGVRERALHSTVAVGGGRNLSCYDL